MCIVSGKKSKYFRFFYYNRFIFPTRLFKLRNLQRILRQASLVKESRRKKDEGFKREHCSGADSQAAKVEHRLRPHPLTAWTRWPRSTLTADFTWTILDGTSHTRVILHFLQYVGRGVYFLHLPPTSFPYPCFM